MLPLTKAIFISLAISQASSISVFDRLGERSEEHLILQRTKRQAVSHRCCCCGLAHFEVFAKYIIIDRVHRITIYQHREGKERERKAANL